MVGHSNFFFNNFASSKEQQLLDDLIVESIGIYGEDMLYVPRELVNYDSLLGADDQSRYRRAIPVVIYIEDVDGFSGDRNFMSKFGVEIRDQVKFSIAMRVFDEEVTSLTKQRRPNEGDLIFFPLNQKCFQITYVEKFSMFYPLGKLYTWQMTCELFEYSDETMSTGVPAIDVLAKKYNTNELSWGLLNESGLAMADETGALILLPGADMKTLIAASDNEELQKEGNTFVQFNVQNPFADEAI